MKLKVNGRNKIREYILKSNQSITNIYPHKEILETSKPSIRILFEEYREDIICTIKDDNNIIGIGISKADKHKNKFKRHERIEIAELRAWKDYYFVMEKHKFHE